jgi:hypothetical protein
MAEKAHVTSVDAIEEFRSHLVLYLSKARPTLEEVSSDVTRMRLWLENDQRTTLEGLLRRRTKDLEQAQVALSSARMAALRSETSAEQMAVQRSRRALEETEGKLKRMKQWNREFDSRVEPLARQLEKLHTFLANDLGQAVAQLSRVVQALDSYADVAAPATGATAGPTSPQSSAESSAAGAEGSSSGGAA